MGILWYADETSPGNLLSLDLGRKVWCLYFTFREFGQHALHNADLWFSQGVLRSAKVSAVQGGFATVFNECMQMFWGDARNMKTDGVKLWLAEDRFIWVFAELAAMLGDERGIKDAWAFKGSAGLKPCHQCANLLSQRVDGIRRPLDRWCLDLGCPDISKFVATTDRYWCDAADRLLDLQRRGAPMREIQEMEN